MYAEKFPVFLSGRSVLTVRVDQSKRVVRNPPEKKVWPQTLHWY
jgi:hypothetical protein